jgi:hypothetical protein
MSPGSGVETVINVTLLMDLRVGDNKTFKNKGIPGPTGTID